MNDYMYVEHEVCCVLMGLSLFEKLNDVGCCVLHTTVTCEILSYCLV